jgi:3-dehydro-L-gulonate 2-dehydrogenase
MATILSGGLSTHQIRSCSSEHGVSQVFIAISIKALNNFPSIESSINQIIDDLHNSTPENPTSKIRYPGENVLETRKTNLEKGIPIREEAWKNLTGIRMNPRG